MIKNNLKKGGIIFFLVSWALSNSQLIVSQTVSKDETSQYLYTEFTPAKVKLKGGNIQSVDLNFNMATGNMIYTRDGKYYDMINIELIDTVYFEKSEFVPSGKTFFEVLIKKPIALFVHYSGNLIPPGKASGYGGTSQTSSIKSISTLSDSHGVYNLSLPQDYTVTVDYIYYIRTGDTYNQFINERQFLKMYSSKEGDLKDFIKKNKTKFNKPSDVQKLVNYLSSLG